MSSGRNFYLVGFMLALVAMVAFGLNAIPASAQDATPIIVVITATPSAAPYVAPVVVAPVVVVPNCPNSVVVKPGDDLYRIALADNTSWPILVALNHIPNPNLIYVGQTICLPAPIAAVATATAIAVTPDLTQTADALLTGTPVPPLVSDTPTLIPTNTLVPPVVMPPPTVYPSIALNKYLTGSGDTVVITGIYFVPNSTLDIYLAPYNALAPGVPTGTAVATTMAAGDGTLSVNFVIPSAPDGTPLRGQFWTITVRSRANNYYGYTSYTNNR